MKKWMIAAAVIAVLVIVGMFRCRHFLTDRIMDGGGMETPFLPETESEETREVSETAELVAFFWHQNAMSYDDCFTFEIHAVEQDSPILRCDYTDVETGERIEIGDYDYAACPPVSPERWAELSDFLRRARLPACREPDPNLPDATSSRISVEWREGGGQFTIEYDGIHANDLLELLQDIAEEAYSKV